MVLAQKFKDFLRLGGLGECGVTAQVAEHDDDLTAMAFEDFFVPVRDYEFGQLRREKALQPPDPAQFIDLLGDARFKPAVQLCHLVGALAQFRQEARVLHRDDRLRRETLQEGDLFVGEWADFLAIDLERAQKSIVFA